MARVFRGKIAIPGDQMEAYFEALGQFEQTKAPMRTQLEQCARGRCFKGVDLLSSIRGREAEKLQHTRVLSWIFKCFTAPTVKARVLCAMA